MYLQVGSKVRLNRDMMKEKSGSIGFVYETYFRGESVPGGKLGASIIFSNGSFDGFSEEESDLFLEYIEEEPSVSGYIFKNVAQVEKDYRLGYWKFK